MSIRRWSPTGLPASARASARRGSIDLGDRHELEQRQPGRHCGRTSPGGSDRHGAAGSKRDHPVGESGAGGRRIGPPRSGRGHADAAAAHALLDSGTAPDTAGAAGGTNKNVSVNILQGAGVPTFTDVVTRSVTGLKPGQRFETYYKVPSNTSAIVVTLSGVTPGDNQNVLFGDNILLTVHSAKTSAANDYKVFQFTSGGMWTIPDPDAGLMRVTLNGNWTNASPIGATVTIAPQIAASPGQTVQASLLDGETKVLPVHRSARRRIAERATGVGRPLGDVSH